MKDKTPYRQKHHAIYQFTCPGGDGTYMSKMERCLLLCMNEHGTLMFKHLSECEFFKESCSYKALESVCNNNNENIWKMSHIPNAVLCNYEILDICNN